MGQPTAGLVVAQMGGPADEDAVEPFIRAVFSDPAVMRIPGGTGARKLLGTLVAKARGAKIRAAYRQIGGGSPILGITERQAAALESELRDRGHDVRAAVAMRYTRPDTPAAVRELLDRGAERLVLVPLYPQYASVTTGSSEGELRRVAADVCPGIDIRVVRSWWHVPAYLDTQTRMVRDAVGAGPEGRTAVLFSAHGVPQRIADAGDPYTEEIGATVAAIAERLPDGIVTALAYQSRSGPVRWVGPGVDQAVRDLAAAGVENLVVVPIAFVSDHLETLFEIDILLREVALAAGIRHYDRTPVLNDLPETGGILADAVEVCL